MTVTIKEIHSLMSVFR